MNIPGCERCDLLLDQLVWMLGDRNNWRQTAVDVHTELHNLRDLIAGSEGSVITPEQIGQVTPLPVQGVRCEPAAHP